MLHRLTTSNILIAGCIAVSFTIGVGVTILAAYVLNGAIVALLQQVVIFVGLSVVVLVAARIASARTIKDITPFLDDIANRSEELSDSVCTANMTLNALADAQEANTSQVGTLARTLLKPVARERVLERALELRERLHGVAVISRESTTITQTLWWQVELRLAALLVLLDGPTDLPLLGSRPGTAYYTPGAGEPELEQAKELVQSVDKVFQAAKESTEARIERARANIERAYQRGGGDKIEMITELDASAKPRRLDELAEPRLSLVTSVDQALDVGAEVAITRTIEESYDTPLICGDRGIIVSMGSTDALVRIHRDDFKGHNGSKIELGDAYDQESRAYWYVPLQNLNRIITLVPEAAANR